SPYRDGPSCGLGTTLAAGCLCALILLSDTEGAEDQAQDVVRGGGAGDVVQGTQRAVEVQQHHLVRYLQRNRAGCLVQRGNSVLHQLLLARVGEKAAFLLRAGIAPQQPQNFRAQLRDALASKRGSLDRRQGERGRQRRGGVRDINLVLRHHGQPLRSQID